MLRYYVCPKNVWNDPHPFAGGRMLPRHNLFHRKGSHYIDLPTDGLILLSADFDDHRNELVWHQQFGVAKLAHPIHERHIPLAHLHKKQEHSHKRYRLAHHRALQLGLGIDNSHTVWDLHERAIKIHPLCRLDNLY